jgi:type I restriction enzyme, S subunit
MGSEWKEYSLTDLYGVSSGLSKPAKDFGEGYPFLSFKDVFYNYFLPDELTQLVRSSDKERNACSIKRGDVFLTRTSETMDELGMSSVARKDYPDATFNGFCKRLRRSTDIPLYPEYVGYFLRSPRFRNELTAFSTMSTRASLNNDMIGRLNITLPPFAEQKAIAHILGSLDDKIELNRRMNRTLEGMSQALFKSWFVDFDPVLDNTILAGNSIPEELAERAEIRRQALSAGTANREAAKPFPAAFQLTKELGWIPEGWEACEIGNELETILGGTPARKNQAYWTDGIIPWINSGKINEFRVIEPSELITEEAVKRSATKLLPKRTTLLAITGATLGQVSINEIICCANQSVIGIVGNEQFPNEYIYLWVQNSIGKIISSQTGGAQQHINKSNVNETKILRLDAITRSRFSEMVSAMFDSIANNCNSNLTLAKLRDTLLPKLISGEILIPDAEKLAEETGL